MKTVTKDILGFELPIPGVADSLAEAAQKSGSEERALAYLNNYVLFHSHFTKLRSKVVAKLVELTRIPMLTEQKGEKTVVIETDGDYIDRLESELGEGALLQYAPHIIAVSEGFPVDYSVSIRGTSGTAKPAKKWLAYYDAMVEKGVLEQFVAKHQIDTTDLDDEAVKIAVANKVKEIITKAELAARQAAASAL